MKLSKIVVVYFQKIINQKKFIKPLKTGPKEIILDDIKNKDLHDPKRILDKLSFKECMSINDFNNDNVILQISKDNKLELLENGNKLQI